MPGKARSGCLFCLDPGDKLQRKCRSDDAADKEQRLLSRFCKKGGVCKSAAFGLIDVLSEAFICSVCKEVYDKLFGVYVQYERLEREIDGLIADLKFSVVRSSRRCSDDKDVSIYHHRVDKNVRIFRRNIASLEESGALVDAGRGSGSQPQRPLAVIARGNSKSGSKKTLNYGTKRKAGRADIATNTMRSRWLYKKLRSSYTEGVRSERKGEEDADAEYKSCKGEDADNNSCAGEDADYNSCAGEDADYNSCTGEDADNNSCAGEDADNNSCAGEDADYNSCTGADDDTANLVRDADADVADLNAVEDDDNIGDSVVGIADGVDDFNDFIIFPGSIKKDFNQAIKMEGIPDIPEGIERIEFGRIKSLTKVKKEVDLNAEQDDEYLNDSSVPLEDIPYYFSSPGPLRKKKLKVPVVLLQRLDLATLNYYGSAPFDRPESPVKLHTDSDTRKSSRKRKAVKPFRIPEVPKKIRINKTSLGKSKANANVKSLPVPSQDVPKVKSMKWKKFPCPYCSTKPKKDWVLRLHIFGQHNEHYLKDYPPKSKELTEEIEQVPIQEPPPVEPVSEDEPESEDSGPNSDSEDEDYVDEDGECENDNPRDKDYVVPLSIKEERRNKVKPVKPVGPFTCDVCGRLYKSLGLLNAHISKSHEKKSPSVCPVCDKKFMTQRSMVQHLIIVHEQTAESKPLNCSTCGKAFCNEFLLKRHEGLHKYDATMPLACDVCDTRYKVGEEALLEKHKNLKHETTRPVDKDHPCEFCGKMFKAHSAYLVHVAKHHVDESSFPCTNCPLRYPSADLLNTHERTHSTDLLVFHCLICNARLKSGELLGKHLLQHFFIAACPAEGCGTFLYSQEQGIRHQARAHGAELPFQCSYCDKRFITRLDLSGHTERIHEVVPFKFKCTLCNKGFAYKSAMTMHYRKDHLKKRYVCEVCGKALLTMTSLRTHVDIHRGIKHDCPHCGVQLSSVNNLKRHVQTLHHNGETSSSTATATSEDIGLVPSADGFTK